jgi:hypothetical protein
VLSYERVDGVAYIAMEVAHEAAASLWTDATPNPWAFHYKVTAVDFAGNESEAGFVPGASAVSGDGMPRRTALLGAVPNPFNPSTRLSFEVAAAGHARLVVYDVSGRLVRTLIDSFHDVGRFDVVWDGRNDAGHISAAGVYLYRLETDGVVETKRMLLVK